MAESASHKRAKSRAAGVEGRTEVPLPRGKRLDALSASGRRATEVERSGSQARLDAAAQRLKSSRAPQRILQVPQPHMDMAAAAMKNAGVSGSVKNLSGTKRRSVRRT